MDGVVTFIAGVVLALGLARVSPSGKARASQAVALPGAISLEKPF